MDLHTRTNTPVPVTKPSFFDFKTDGYPRISKWPEPTCSKKTSEQHKYFRRLVSSEGCGTSKNKVDFFLEPFAFCRVCVFLTRHTQQPLSTRAEVHHFPELSKQTGAFCGRQGEIEAKCLCNREGKN